MTGTFIKTALLALVLGFSFSTAVRAEEGGTAPAKTPGKKQDHPIEFILNHAADLSLTADQQKQLEALKVEAHQHHAQDPAATTGQHPKWLREKLEKILTADQLEKLKELRKENRPGAAGK